MRFRPRQSRRFTAAATGAMVAVLGLGVPLAGCGAGRPERSDPESAPLAGHSGTSPAELAGAVRLARRFARAYGRGAYLRRAPGIRQESVAVRRALATSVTRVPPDRRSLRPHLVGLRLWLRSGGAVGATARIGDGRSPSFSIGFTVSHRGRRWLITSISPPD